MLFIFSVSLHASTIIRFSHVVSEDSPKGRAIAFFKKELERVTSGELRVHIYSNGAIFDDASAIKAVQKNIIQFAAPSFSKFNGIVDDFQVFDIPYLFRDTERVHIAYYGNIGSILKVQAEKKNMVILAFWDNGFKHLTNNIKPLILPTDLKGLRFRTMGSSIIKRQFDLLDAKAYVYPFSKLKSVIIEGVIDGQENTFSNIYTQEIHKHQQYMTLSGHGYLGYAVIVSKEFWDNLTENQREIIQYTLNRATQLEIELAKKANIDNYYRIKYEVPNMHIYTLTDVERNIWTKFFSKYDDIFYLDISDKIIKEAQKLR